MLQVVALAAAWMSASSPTAAAQSVSSLADFTQLSLQGVNINNPTSIAVGADGKIYLSQQNGLLVALTVARTFGTNNAVATETWTVTNRADIDLVKSMPNHDDEGNYLPNTNNRQVTGIATDVDANGNVMLYVTSSDPRIGGGGGGQDKGLDTNSGVISRLEQVVDANGDVVLDSNGDPTWTKLDLVRGFPRSEENHAINGLEIVPGTPNRLLVAVGGFTNAGTQGNNFAYTPEYYYSGAMVWVDLDALDSLQQANGYQTYTTSNSPDQYVLYDLPTLDDPTRPNAAGGGDLPSNGGTTADVFGGNDGLNQAIYDTGNIVSLASVGFRNQYDVLVTTAGEVYTVDNGSNSGWGGVPVNASGSVIVDNNNDGVPDNGPAVYLSNESGQVNKGDQLHRIIDDINNPPATMFYGGHPNLYRAYAAGAGFYLYAASNNNLGLATGTPLTLDANNALVSSPSPVDLAFSIPNANLLTGLDGNGNPIIDPRQAMFLAPGRSTGFNPNAPDGSLYVWSPSTNGLDEYTASNGLQGQLLTVAFNGSLYALDVAQGGAVQSVDSRNLTTKPLDVIAQGDNDPYPGVIFVAAYGADQVVILSPQSGVGVSPDPNDRDLDGIDDTLDPFCVDPHNGTHDVLQAGNVWSFTFANGPNDTPPNASPALYDGTGGLFSGGAIGFTGIMTNRAGLPETLYDANNIIFGGAPGVLQIKEVDTGSPTNDTQRNGFQVGFKPGGSLSGFTVETSIDNFFDEIGAIPATEYLSQGLFIGTGDQNNFVSVSMVRLADGRVGFEVESQFAQDFVGASPSVFEFTEVPDLALANALDTAMLGLDVDPATAAVTPWWSYTYNGTDNYGTATPVTLSGAALAALNGTLTMGDNQGNLLPMGMAAGVLSSRDGTTGTFAADFDDLTISGHGNLQPGALVTAVNAGGNAFTDSFGVTYEADTYGAGKKYSTSAGIAGTVDDTIYQSKTWKSGGWTYEVPVTNGTYLVELHFAEIWSGAFSTGSRVFDVLLEGQTVHNSLDVYAEVGQQTAFTSAHQIDVTDGSLTISSSPVVQNPKISGFAIWTAVVPDTQAPTAGVTKTEPAVADDPLSVAVTFSDDQALDVASITQGDATITGSGATIEVLNFAVSPTGDGLTAVATWDLRPIGGWNGDIVTFDIAADAVVDVAGNGAPAVSTTFSHITDPFVIAVNAGGPAYTDSLGVVYQADTYANGNSYSTAATIAGTTDPTLYQSERWMTGGFTYEIPVTNGDYSVELHFAEIWSGAFNPGQRVFDVQVEGQLVFDNLDVVTEAGAPLTAHIIDVTTTVADGSLTITTVPVVQNPKLSAFSVWHVTAPPPTPTPPPSSTPATTAFSDPTVQGLIDTTDAVSGTGGALLTITPGNNVQKSNYGNNSFSLTNTGTKRIAAVYLDVSTALFSDVVFDGDGTGGDSVAKVLTYNSGGGTVGAIGQGSYNWLWQPARGGSFVANAAFSSSALTDVDNLFVDATSNSGKPSPAAGGGFRGELLLFTGFDATETVGFSGDMDPNSIAGLTKNSVDSGSNQAGTNSNFDVGGVSGAEMVGSIVTVLFGDGTTATGMLAHDGTQSGAVAVIGANAAAPGLTVNGVSPGGTGTYGGTRPTIVATGPPGDVVRVTMVKAFDPTGNTSSTVATGAITVDALVEARLLAQYPDFPVNNAVQWQHVDVTIPSGGSVDLTQNAAFDYVNINNVGGANDFTDDDILPIAFVAVTVDAQGQPLGDTSAPIRLINAGGPVP